MRARTALLTAAGCCALVAGAPAAHATERPAHYITTVVGNGEGARVDDDDSDYPDGTPARRAAIGSVGAVATASDGTLYFLDAGKVRAVDPKTQQIRTVAGTGKDGFSGDGGPAVEAELSVAHDYSDWEGTTDLAVGPDDTLYIADSGNQRVRAVDPKTKKIRTVAGSGPTGDDADGYSGDGGPATRARMNYPSKIAVAKDGTLYIGDRFNYVVRAVDPDGTIDTVAGHPVDDGYGLDGDIQPDALTVGTDGNVYIADTQEQEIRVYDPRQKKERVAFDSFRLGLFLDDVTGASLTTGRDGELYLGAAGRVFVLDSKKQTVTRFAGRATAEQNAPLGDGGPALEASLFGGTFNGPAPDLAVAQDGTVYATDPGHGRIRAISEKRPAAQHVAGKVAARDIGPFAGRGEVTDEESLEVRESDDDYRIDELPVVEASGVAVADDGTVYIADRLAGQVRKVDPDGDRARVVAGQPESTTSYDNTARESGKATDVEIEPSAIALGRGHTLYVVDGADIETFRLLAIDLDENTYRTVYTVHGFDDINDVTIGPDGIPYVTTEGKVCRLGRDRVCREVEEFGTFPAVEVADDGTIYYSAGSQVRTIDLESGRTEPVAGNGFSGGVDGDGGPALDASLGIVSGMSFGDDGILYLADTANHRIRAYDPRTRALDTVAGTGHAPEVRTVSDEQYPGGGFGGNGNRADKAQLDSPQDVAVGPGGELYIADTGNGRIRVVGDAHLDERSAPFPVSVLLANLLTFAIAIVAAVRFRPRSR